MKSILDLVEEIHVTSKGEALSKPEWREYMRKFKENEQIYTHQPIQIEQEEEEDEEEVNISEINEDYIAAVGKWNPRTLIDSRREELIELLSSYNLELPDFEGFVNNNSILGKAIKEITRLGCPYDAQYAEALYQVPNYMPLKLLVLGNPFENQKEVYELLKEEFSLTIFDIEEINAEIDKIINPPEEEEAPDPKKAKGKGAPEEPPENEEEIKQITAIAEEFKQYKEDNPGIVDMPEDFLMKILAIKIKYAFEEKSDEDILKEIKEGIKADIFRDPEDEADPKKAKGKGQSKEELEEEMLKYKNVQPSGYMIVNLPNTKEVLIQYEKVFNGFTDKSEITQTAYEKSRSESNKLFP